MKPWKSFGLPIADFGLNGFNGATAMKPWKSSVRTAIEITWEKLQWGHGDEAVEEAPLA